MGRQKHQAGETYDGAILRVLHIQVAGRYGRGSLGLYGTPDIFYHTHEEARAEIMAMLRQIEDEPDETPGVHQIERIETLPVSKETLIVPLNEGMGAFIKSYEIVEIVG